MNLKLLFNRLTWTAVAIIAAALVILLVTKMRVDANPPRFEHHQTQTASSTLAYLKKASSASEHATTTLSYLTNGAESVDLHLLVTPSSTESTLQFKVEYSPNNIDWYGENVIARNPDVEFDNYLQSSTTPAHLWRPTTTTASNLVGKVIRFDNVQSDYMRFVFNAVDGTASNNLGLWADAVAKIQEP